MKLMFDDPMFERPGIRTLSHAVFGGADFGECLTTARRITEGAAESWHRQWLATANRVFDIAETCAAKEHEVSARTLFHQCAFDWLAEIFNVV
jgi:hypothetical protein